MTSNKSALLCVPWVLLCLGSSDQTQGLLASILRFLSELGPFPARLLLGLQSQPGGCSPPPRAPVRPTQALALCLWEREERRETERASPVYSASSSGFHVPAHLFAPLSGFLPVSRRLPSATSSCHLCPVTLLCTLDVRGPAPASSHLACAILADPEPGTWGALGRPVQPSRPSSRPQGAGFRSFPAALPQSARISGCSAG